VRISRIGQRGLHFRGGEENKRLGEVGVPKIGTTLRLGLGVE